MSQSVARARGCYSLFIKSAGQGWLAILRPLSVNWWIVRNDDDGEGVRLRPRKPRQRRSRSEPATWLTLYKSVMWARTYDAKVTGPCRSESLHAGVSASSQRCAVR